jgi:hypothetical protein
MSTDSSENERFYDEEIAPALMEIATKLKARGMGMVATVEYAPGQRGDTYALPADACLAMRMVQHCSKTAPNVDGYMIGIIRYCKEQGIDTSASMFMNKFAGATA